MSRSDPTAGRGVLVKELSSRLVALRKRAGMTQQAVADAMGKSRGGERLVRRLERGGTETASLLSVVEYLRAVRAGFFDLKEVLDRYASLPIPEPQRKRAEEAPLPRVQTSVRTCENGDSPSERADARYSPRFQEKRELRSRTPSREEELRVLRLRRRAGYWALRRLFEFYLHSGLDSAPIPSYVRFRRVMATYARRFFNALYRTHRAKEGKRAERLARLRASVAKQALAPSLVEYAEAIAEFAYNEMREHDELDWMPPEAEARATMALKSKHRVVTDFQMCYAEWSSVWSRYASAALAVYERAHKAALEVADSARCDARTLFRYRQAAMRAGNIARTTLPDTPERKRSVANWNATDWPAEMDRRLLDRILAAGLAVCDASLSSLPPAPGPMPR
jgi:transcriptional regulator with XRE-family HTH domain